MAEEKVFRSLIKRYFSTELLIKLNELTLYHDVDNNSKTEEIVELLTEYEVPFSRLGSGTNRYGIKIEEYAVKIALDRMGKIDNKREFKYTKNLYPYVVKVYETTLDGLIAVSEYVTPFSERDLYEHEEDMREILEVVSSNFLIGDIGISRVNYGNWGYRLDGSVCILDFAYIYSLSYKGFKCTCEDEGTLEYDRDYNYFICPFCRKKWSFGQIRKRITKQDEINEIGDITEIGYVLHNKTEKQPIDPNKSPMPKEKKKKKDEKPIRKKNKPNYDLSSEEQLELLKNNNI